jgi:hypothetical protein
MTLSPHPPSKCVGTLACTHSPRPASIRDHLHQNASGSHHTRFPSCVLSVTCPCPLAPLSPLPSRPSSPSRAPAPPPFMTTCIKMCWAATMPIAHRVCSRPPALALSHRPLVPTSRTVAVAFLPPSSPSRAFSCPLVAHTLSLAVAAAVVLAVASFTLTPSNSCALVVALALSCSNHMCTQAHVRMQMFAPIHSHLTHLLTRVCGLRKGMLRRPGGG